MSYHISFKNKSKASPIREAMSYNNKGVRAILKGARDAAKQGKPWNKQGFQFLFSFAGIQGFPVTVIHKLMKRKGLAK